MKNDDLDQLDVEPSTSPRMRPILTNVQSHDSKRSYEALRPAELDWHWPIRVLYKRRWPAATVFLLVFGTMAVYTVTAVPIYEATARLLIESDERNVVSFQQVVDEDQAKADYYQTQYSILQSRALARKTLDVLRLWDSPDFARAPREQGKGMDLWDSIKRTFFSHSEIEKATQNAMPEADETMAQSRAIDAFMSRLTISPVRNSRLVDVRFQLPDAYLAASIVNSLSKNYIDQNLEYKFLASKEASNWLGERLTEQRQQVRVAELALQQYRERNDAISLQASENIVVQKLGDLNAAVTRAKTVRIEKEALYNQLRLSQSNPVALDTFPAILANPFIQQQKSDLASLQREQAQLSEKLGDKHPEMQKVAAAIQISQEKLKGEIAKVVQAVRSEYQAALAQENSLTAALSQQKAEALSMNRKAIDYGVLERDVESSRQIYDSLMQRAKETGVAGELRTSNIRVIDEAEQPGKPLTPNRGLNLVLGFVGGLALAITLMVSFEYLDSRIKTPDDIRTHLGIPSLGLLPRVGEKSHEGRYPLISNGVPPNFSEAFRAVRTNVLFSTAEEGPRSIVVTSTRPGEGKSMVACNMAVGLAQSGQRVLLIDADMRKPKTHEIFEIQQEPGLSNLLVAQSKASETVRKTLIPGLWVLPAGRTPPNPAELIGSSRFKDFISSLKNHFDWVVIDSPPVMAVTDASIIAHEVTGVLFVIGAEMTSRHAARRALDQLEQVQAKLVGAVLNGVDVDRNPYYYSDYYRREYAEYYVKVG